jgi:rSAM/selenodomain-associated transferase 1
MPSIGATVACRTIIVFTREPMPGATKTRLIPRLGANNAAALADAFACDALAKARATGLNLVVAGSAPGGVAQSDYFRRLARRFDADLIDQGGGGLGARMSRVLTPHCASGALLFGADTPSLPVRMLMRSAALLDWHPVVLGASLDGGYYLVGARGGMPDIFRGIRWGRSNVLALTIARLNCTRTRYALADGWYDIDRWSDLTLLVAHLRSIRRTEPDPCPETSRILQRLGLL